MGAPAQEATKALDDDAHVIPGPIYSSSTGVDMIVARRPPALSGTLLGAG